MSEETGRSPLNQNGYGQRKPDVADWTYGAHSIIPDTSMDSLQAHGGLRVECS